MSKPTAASVQAQIDTHEAVCAERWKEPILRIKRIETIMIGTAGTTIVLLVCVLQGQGSTPSCCSFSSTASWFQTICISEI